MGLENVCRPGADRHVLCEWKRLVGGLRNGEAANVSTDGTRCSKPVSSESAPDSVARASRSGRVVLNGLVFKKTDDGVAYRNALTPHVIRDDAPRGHDARGGLYFRPR
jgi:hypothetical protein